MNENLKRKLIGIIAAILSVITFMGVITPEDADTANQAVTGLLENIGAGLSGVFALWAIFTKKK